VLGPAITQRLDALCPDERSAMGSASRRQIIKMERIEIA